MMELRRITTQYSKQEDRLCLSGEGQGGHQGQTQVLWLTQRLLNRLVPYLTNWLEQQQKGTPHGSLLQEFQQQAAVAALEPQAPVQSQPTSTTFLVCSVDIATGEKAVRLGFKEQETGPVVVRVVLPTQALRQWLGVVYQQYRMADWPTNVWPEWVMDANMGRTTAGQSAWH